MQALPKIAEYFSFKVLDEAYKSAWYDEREKLDETPVIEADLSTVAPSRAAELIATLTAKFAAAETERVDQLSEHRKRVNEELEKLKGVHLDDTKTA